MNIPMDMVYTFGALNSESIYQKICSIVGNDRDVTINIAKTTTSISFFKEKVFNIRINSKTQSLVTEDEFVFPFIQSIAGASLHSGDKRNYAQIPLITDNNSVSIVYDMLQKLFQECFNRQNTESFGCCNDHVRCSDARRCLHEGDKFYLGCIYRKNLEAGRIYYGMNRNVEDNIQ